MSREQSPQPPQAVSEQAQFPSIKRIGARLSERVLGWSVPLLCSAKRLGATDAIRSILVVEPYGLGDLVLASGFIASLHRLHPDAAIGVVCDERWEAFVRDLPGVTEVYVNSYPWATGRWTRRNIARVIQVALALRAKKYDVGIDIRGDIRSQALLVAAGCRDRIGFTDYLGSTIELRGLLLTSHVPCGVSQRLEELHRLLCLVPGGASSPPLHIEIPHAPKAARVGGSLVLGLHPGAGHVFKKWPIAHWRALVDTLRQVPPVKIVLLGSRREQPELQAIADGLLSADAVQPCATVGDLVDAISSLDLLICLDSAPFHIAAGTQTPAIALFGPGQPSRWSHPGAPELLLRPPGYRAAASRDERPLGPTDFLVAGITPDEVVWAIDALMLASRGAPLVTTDSTEWATPQPERSVIGDTNL